MSQHSAPELLTAKHGDGDDIEFAIVSSRPTARVTQRSAQLYCCRNRVEASRLALAIPPPGIGGKAAGRCPLLLDALHAARSS